jgi:membrane associated rhomboid family serine protease
MSILEDLKMQFRIGGVVTKLIFWNIAFFAIPSIVFGLLSLFHISVDFLSFVSLSSNPIDLLWKPWSIISYAFFHFGIFHLLFNLLMLHFAGRLFLVFFTPKQFLSLYFVSAIFSGMIYIIGYRFIPVLIHVNTSLVGASAAIMAILFATVAYSPFMEIRLLLLGNVKLWHIALILIGVDLIQLPMNNTGGHLAHLGGAFFGYLYISQLKRGIDICGWFSIIVDALANVFGNKKAIPFKKVHRNFKSPPVKRTSKIIQKDKQQQQIDEILDKISQSGYDSLTKDEKEFLFQSGK